MPAISVFPTTCDHVIFSYDGKNYEFVFDSDFDKEEPEIIQSIKIDIAENNNLNTAAKIRNFLDGKVY